MKTIKHEEYTYHSRPVILDATQIGERHFEVMLMSQSGGTEYTTEIATDEAAALRAFNRIRAAHLPDDERITQAPAPLTGEYAKLRDNLCTVHKIGLEAAAKVDDSGTCNLDAPALHLPHWKTALIKQACEEAGGGCFTLRDYGAPLTVVSLPIPGQAYKRETAARAMTKALQEMGYNAYTYFRMD